MDAEEIKKLEQDFENNFNCYAKADKVIMAMTKECVIEFFSRNSTKYTEEIERLKGLIRDAYNLGYDNSSFAHDEKLKNEYEHPETFEQFQKANNL